MQRITRKSKMMVMIFLVRILGLLILQRRRTLQIVRLGSSYGGWSLAHLSSLNSCAVVSAGLGQDASFDVEIINNYECEVYVLDPTPHAIVHAKEIVSSFGQTRSTEYSSGGTQVTSSYQLEKVNSQNFQFLPLALWCESNRISMVPPENPNHSSYHVSQRDLQNEDVGFPAIDIAELQEIVGREISVLKMDIEGAELKVINRMLQSSIYPTQLLVEFDCLKYGGFIKLVELTKLLLELKHKNYVLAAIDGLNVSMVREA